MKILLTLILFAIPAYATDTNVFFLVLKTTGRNYTNATVKAFTPSHLTVYHDGGIAKVDKQDLNEWIQMRFEGGEKAEQAKPKQESQNANQLAYYSQMAAMLSSRFGKLEEERKSLERQIEAAKEASKTITVRSRNDPVRIGNFIGMSFGGKPSVSNHTKLKNVNEEIAKVQMQLRWARGNIIRIRAAQEQPNSQ